MIEGTHFSNPHEELEYLRSKVIEAEKELERFGVEKERTEVIRDSIKKFEEHPAAQNPDKIGVAHKEAEALMEKHREVELEEMMRITEEKGMIHALRVVEKLKGWRLEDDFHDFLITLVSKGLPPRGVKEGGPIYQALHLTLYEVVLPKGENDKDKPLSELIKSMEQLYAGFLSIAGEKGESNYMVFEIANPLGEEDTRAFVSVPTGKRDMFERQLLTVFPNARLLVRERDYNIFNEFGTTLGASAKLSSFAAYPLKTFEALAEDPLNIILSGFSKIPANGGGAVLQIVFRPAGTKYIDRYKRAVEEIQKGKKPKEVLETLSFTREVGKTFGEMFFSKKKDPEQTPNVDSHAVEAIHKKIESPIVEAIVRLAVSAPSPAEAKQILHNIESAFNQFENPGHNAISWNSVSASKESDFYRSFIFRLFREDEALPLNLRELSTILHFHTQSLLQNSPLKRSTSRSAPPPSALQDTGTLLGINSYQGLEKKIYISREDRLRHFYSIGQTGTGKSTLLKNMIIDDIRSGHGACMIDPHGTDILDVLANIPKERMGDVIYFDPAATARPLALNMLEYDPRYPEQKTFVVNELFSIFQKLYGGVPESMGPMFEQYFRNATMLVIEDPETGCTLLDVSRVMANKEYRELKISHCKNPVIVQFWTEVASKAGGEAKLENIVPYITSKFDVFLANEIMRPIIAQEKSSFNFREIMDERKILLVNLSKGRLGEINANLIGLILVGKILMAALSRVDSIGQDLPPFYLTIDEFHFITTNSIASILSEARKYKLSLTLAHQHISQIEDNIRNAVFGNVGSICSFRVGNDDAEYLEKQFAPTFSASDLSNIDNFNAYVKMLVNGKPSDPFDIRLMPRPEGDRAQVELLKEESSRKYGRNREDVERAIAEKYKKAPIPNPALNLDSLKI